MEQVSKHWSLVTLPQKCYQNLVKVNINKLWNDSVFVTGNDDFESAHTGPTHGNTCTLRSILRRYSSGPWVKFAPLPYCLLALKPLYAAKYFTFLHKTRQLFADVFSCNRSSKFNIACTKTWPSYCISSIQLTFWHYILERYIWYHTSIFFQVTTFYMVSNWKKKINMFLWSLSNCIPSLLWVP
jgi:hypothetical protein